MVKLKSPQQTKESYALLFAFLNLADVVTTFIGVKYLGLLEMNFIMQQAIGVGWITFVFIKFLVGFYIMDELYVKSDFLVPNAPKRKVANVVGFGTIAIYAATVMMNITKIVLVVIE